MPTKWIAAGAALVVVIVVCLVIVLLAVASDRSTTTVEPTTSTSSSTTSTTPRPTPSTAAEPSDVSVQLSSITVQGRDRTALEIAPAQVAPGTRLPVVVVLHGLGVNAQAMSRTADWRGAVARDGFLAVFPQGVSDSWNLGPCCPPANLLGVPDRAYLDALVAELVARDDVDAERMYLTGFSNGALMVYRYACDRPEVFAAVAPMAGSNVTGCAPPQPVSLLHQHGDADLVVPYGGGIGLGSLVSSAPFPAVRSSVGAWAAADGCSEPPAVSEGDGVVRTQWSTCADGARVELVTVPGKGHDWLTTPNHDPLEEMLTFFGLT